MRQAQQGARVGPAALATLILTVLGVAVASSFLSWGAHDQSPQRQRLLLPSAELQPKCDEGEFMGCIDHGGDIESILPWTKTLPRLKVSHPLHRNPLGQVEGPANYVKHLQGKARAPNLPPATSHTADRSSIVAAARQLQPTHVPSRAPTDLPSVAPTHVPSRVPTDLPSVAPTRFPTLVPSH